MAIKKKTASKAPASVKTPAKKAAVKKAPVKKATVKKAPAKKAAVKKAPVKKAAVKKAPAKKAAVSKPVVKQAPAKKVAAKAVVEVPSAPVVAAPVAIVAPEERRLVMPPPPRHIKSTKKVAPLKPIKVAPAPAAVSDSEGPFTTAEFKSMRAELAKELVRLQNELVAVESEMDALIRESGEGAGDDQADAGTKTFEREHEMSLVINARDMVLQTERALERIDAKTYGQCEECGNPIGKARLQVFPRATLCMVCKQKEERR
ncbi:MAG: TraR/DksA C4-type zinc finger protein [Actinobacteria bacterium]|nr:TraR/DksA C4-type zinc finger protein [Actinomycetota bacterium]